MNTTSHAGLSTLHKFMFPGMAVRGVLVRLVGEWQALLGARPGTQAYPVSVRNILGQMTAASALLQANIKFDGTLIMQLYGDGPLKLAVAEMQSDLRFRATAKINGSISDNLALPGLVNQHGLGRCAITLEPKIRSSSAAPYQGVVPLNREDGQSLQTIAQMIELYMAQSEQLQTRLILAANENVATGILLQRLPSTGGNQADAALEHLQLIDHESLEEHFQRLSILTASTTEGELLDLDPSVLLHRLFWDEPLETLELLSGAQGPRFQCSCTRERVSNMLRSLGREEVQDIVREQGQVEISCEFCGRYYRFDPVDAGELFVHQHNHPPASPKMQ